MNKGVTDVLIHLDKVTGDELVRTARREQVGGSGGWVGWVGWAGGCVGGLVHSFFGLGREQTVETIRDFFYTIGRIKHNHTSCRCGQAGWQAGRPEDRQGGGAGCPNLQRRNELYLVRSTRSARVAR